MKMNNSNIIRIRKRSARTEAITTTTTTKAAAAAAITTATTKAQSKHSELES